MGQKLKEDVRERIHRAAERVFAHSGYVSATMAQIAAEADISTGNIYRYYQNKDALFESVVSDEFAKDFMRLVKARVAALVEADNLTELAPEAQERASQLLRFWIDHRLKVVIILDRAQGSRHEGFAAQFVRELSRQTLAKMKRDHKNLKVTKIVRFGLDNILSNSVRAIVAILETFEDEPQIRTAFAGFWSYQLAGLAGFTKWVTT